MGQVIDSSGFKPDPEVAKRLEGAQDEVAADQERRLLVDLDAAWGEWKRREEDRLNPWVVQFEDRDYSIPAEPRIGFRALWLRHCIDGDGQIKPTEDRNYLAMIEQIGNDELLTAVMRSEKPMSFIAETLLFAVLRLWGFIVIESPGDDEKKSSPTDPTQTPGSSSGDGEPSSPTSSDTTEKT